MPSIRTTRTASNSTAVQVVRYENRKTVVMKHIGSAKTREEVDALMESAQQWLEYETGQSSLFPKTEQRTLPLTTTQYLGTTHSFARDVLLEVATVCGFDAKRDALLLDFAVMRLLEPVSKLRSIELMKRYFNIRYSERIIYRTLPRLHTHKEALEEIATTCALRTLHNDLSLVLYDVTTLYFETFTADELRVQGFQTPAATDCHWPIGHPTGIPSGI
jgi:hypothetical protein